MSWLTCRVGKTNIRVFGVPTEVDLGLSAIKAID